MPAESFVKVVKRRLLGVLFLVVVAGLVTLSIAIYTKAFTSTVTVKLVTDSTGNQLQKDSDVQERGVLVGSVSSVKSNGAKATVIIELNPGLVSEIPRNVSAQILPKTLFGEEYVELTPPTKDVGPPITAGYTIYQDSGTLEAQKVLGDLLPLLTAVQPAELNSTLTAIATALTGPGCDISTQQNCRGKQLGDTLAQLDQYLKSTLNPNRQEIVDDVQKLGSVSAEYNDVAPDLLSTLNNLETPVKTLTQDQKQFASLLTSADTAVSDLDTFIAANRQNAIEVVGQTDQVYGLLKTYAPEYSCLFEGINLLQEKANDAVYDHAIHLSGVADLTNQGPYKPGEQPIYITGYGPHCFGLPDDPQPVVDGKFQIPPAYQCVNDGAALTTNPCGAKPSSGPGKGQPTISNSAQSQVIYNSAGENAVINSLIAPDLGTTPAKVPGGSTVLVGPLLRGQQVVVK
jgi:phospholipid/cholesterol/gamma-HCH transport system substrate-binding protein